MRSCPPIQAQMAVHGVYLGLELHSGVPACSTLEKTYHRLDSIRKYFHKNRSASHHHRTNRANGRRLPDYSGPRMRLLCQLMNPGLLRNNLAPSRRMNKAAAGRRNDEVQLKNGQFSTSIPRLPQLNTNPFHREVASFRFLERRPACLNRQRKTTKAVCSRSTFRTYKWSAIA